MKKVNGKTIAAILMAGALLISAGGCGKKVTANGESNKTGITTTVGEKDPAAEIVGNPDKENASERGVMRSLDAKDPVIEELRSAYSEINWQLYSKIVSGSELTVEAIISDKYDMNAPGKITLYVFAYNDEYTWNTEDAFATMEGAPCRPIVDQSYNTIHTYWIQGNLPQEMPTGKYTMVFVLPDGTVDSMVDFDLVQPSEAPAPQAVG